MQCTATQLPASSLNFACSRWSQSSTTCSGGPEPSSNDQSCRRDLLSLARPPKLMDGNFNFKEQRRPSHPKCFHLYCVTALQLNLLSRQIDLSQMPPCFIEHFLIWILNSIILNQCQLVRSQVPHFFFLIVKLLPKFIPQK